MQSFYVHISAPYHCPNFTVRHEHCSWDCRRRRQWVNKPLKEHHPHGRNGAWNTADQTEMAERRPSFRPTRPSKAASDFTFEKKRQEVTDRRCSYSCANHHDTSWWFGRFSVSGTVSDNLFAAKPPILLVDQFSLSRTVSSLKDSLTAF